MAAKKPDQINIQLTPEQAKVMDALRGRERIVPTRNAFARWLLAEALLAHAEKATEKPKAKRVPRAA